MATRPAGGWEITDHAVKRYRERASLCCERFVSDTSLRLAILGQLDFFASHYLKGSIRLVRCGPWRISNKGKNVCENPTHTFICIDRAVVTTLGFGMKVTELAMRHYARMARQYRRKQYEAAVLERREKEEMR